MQIAWMLLGLLVMGAEMSEMPPVSAELKEFIYEKAPFPSCHASTLIQLPDRTVLAAWFGGEAEGDPSVEIWMSRKQPGKAWTKPVQLTNYPEAPCWNPVLFRNPDGRIWLFYKVGPSPQTWVGAYRTSADAGQSWSEPQYLPAGLLGPIRSKPVLLKNGWILAGSSVEAGGGPPAIPRNAPYRTWASYVERFATDGSTWERFGPISVPGEIFGVIQPTVWETSDGELKMLMRATQRIGAICESTSRDGGRTWSPARPIGLPNPNSGVDAVKLQDGRLALVYNHTRQGRTPLNVAVSTDDGRTWGPAHVLESAPGEYSYPAVIQGVDGKLHITYTWQRKRIKYVVVDPATLSAP